MSFERKVKGDLEGSIGQEDQENKQRMVDQKNQCFTAEELKNSLVVHGVS